MNKAARWRQIIAGVAALMMAVGLSLTASSPASAAAVQSGPAAASRQVATSASAMLAKRWWVAPVVGASCSSPFNQLREGPNGPYYHKGRDLLRYYKAPVGAVANGRVIFAGWSGGTNGGYGKVVKIRHGKYGEFVTVYAHLAIITVREGQWVYMGNLIGRMGSTGWSTGTHTHFEWIDRGKKVSPDAYMKTRGVTLCR